MNSLVSDFFCSTMFVRLIHLLHVVVNGSFSLYTIFHSVNVLPCIILSIVNRHLGCFHSCKIHSAPINILLYVFWETYLLVRCVSRDEVVETQGIHMFAK